MVTLLDIAEGKAPPTRKVRMTEHMRIARGEPRPPRRRSAETDPRTPRPPRRTRRAPSQPSQR